MKVRDLLKNIDYFVTDEEVLNREIGEIVIDNNLVKKGDIFVALRGRAHNGNDYINDALQKGASAIVSDEVSGENIIFTKNVRSAYAVMSKNYFGCACDSLKIIAVTGTNGKTTITTAIADVLQSAGYKVGLIGTLGARINGKFYQTDMTTPDPFLLHKLFAKMKDEGNEFCVMEASAHSLYLDKLEGIKFEVGVLTNITEDHLDYFKDMDTYARAKFKLFQNGRVKTKIACAHKDYVDDFVKSGGAPFLTYGIDTEADYVAHVKKMGFAGSKFTCINGKDKFEVLTPLAGRYNIENTLAVIATLSALNIDRCDILGGIKNLKPASGRFNIIKWGKLDIIIDYAHTPDGLESVLKAIKDIAKKRKVVAIFGCGGNRDRLKRPIMGKIAATYADEVIITSDNPRFEEPLSIMKEIQKGCPNGKMIVDRREAIEYALKNHRSGVILIAGKGGENYQEIGGRKIAYSDFDVVFRLKKNGAMLR